MGKKSKWDKSRIRQEKVITENIDNILEKFAVKENREMRQHLEVSSGQEVFFFFSILLCITFLRNLSQCITSLLWHSSHLSCYIYVNIFTYISTYKYNLIALVFVAFHYDQPLPCFNSH